MSTIENLKRGESFLSTSEYSSDGINTSSSSSYLSIKSIPVPLLYVAESSTSRKTFYSRILSAVESGSDGMGQRQFEGTILFDMTDFHVILPPPLPNRRFKRRLEESEEANAENRSRRYRDILFAVERFTSMQG
jgi:hypothetical protein